LSRKRNKFFLVCHVFFLLAFNVALIMIINWRNCWLQLY
jgi:uncharacterized membrane protein (DUF485 family)